MRATTEAHLAGQWSRSPCGGNVAAISTGHRPIDSYMSGLDADSPRYQPPKNVEVVTRTNEFISC